ncbi:Phospholipase D [Ascosphaera apis ARSEF 7405]|uniref:Phospholipase n=1 Tax=Ascosphaera apis ARSEF 7405 TaxID=392613 RepID=A0A167XBF8_9EURO|nr:Phospholipase D [Ascosphaera apis ARSEF 7405]
MSEGESNRGLFAEHFAKFRSRRQAEADDEIEVGNAPKEGFLENLYEKVTEYGSEIAEKIGSTLDPEAYATYGHGHPHHQNRFNSFAPLRLHNNAKWYVDGCSYFWAVSVALEKAQESIWILDWWLSPELYLRRPPAEHEEYRLDRMIKAAAERGVKVNVILYKEVSVANPLESEHSKKRLESLHPNVQVFRHPDHVVHASEVLDNIKENFKDLSLSTLNEDAARTIYGVKQDVILYWAHHEKLLIVDGHIAFMGGLDLCFGRWDTNQHSIADAHPAGPQHNIFPGQDFNDARIQDFKNVENYEDNDVNRFVSPRMGWSDCSVSLSGPVVEDLRRHFVDRWNFIYTEKYQDMDAKDKTKDYAPLELYPGKIKETDYPAEAEDEEIKKGHSGHGLGKILRSKLAGDVHRAQDRFLHSGHFHKDISHGPDAQPSGPTRISTFARSHGGPIGAQICRSACPWSAGIALEHSIQNAYARIIRESEHFIYIENQFFITATGDQQKPVENTVGAAIVERILRAARAGERYHVMVNIPSVPGFAGDLHDDSANGTRAIMEFQYNSINRGGNSIMELIAKEGYNPMDYIRFYNLRNYDRINSTRKMLDTEHDGQDLRSYSEEDAESSRRWDSVAECYMLNGEDIRNVPWDHDDVDEINQFVSEELYIHTKVLIADDRTAIIGSANMNDRSQLGSHDSEIAVIIQDPTEIQSTMNGKPYVVSKFAASLRRHLHKKHLGLLPAQVCNEPDPNFYPVGTPNEFDFDSPESKIVEDPLSDTFQSLWTSRAHTNTQVYRKLFHVVPDDEIRNWDDYKTYFEDNFKGAVVQAADGESTEQVEEDQEHKLIKKTPPKYNWGHIVTEEVPGGVEEVKEELSKIKGTLVEMPLMFLIDEDITKTGLTLNSLTEPIYT